MLSGGGDAESGIRPFDGLGHGLVVTVLIVKVILAD